MEQGHYRETSNPVFRALGAGFIVIFFITLSVILIADIFCHYFCLTCDCSIFTGIEGVCSLCTFLLALVAALYSRREYKSHIFSEYNKRYSEDGKITKVVEFIIRNMFNTHCVYGMSVPTTHEKEIFMRFFEEIERRIQYNSMDEDVAIDMFAYYAVVFAMKENLRQDIDDFYDESSWEYFHSFIDRTKYMWCRIEKEIKSKNNKCRLLKYEDFFDLRLNKNH